MFSSFSLFFLFTLSLLSSVSAHSKPCASQSVKAAISPSSPFLPSRNSHSSHPSLHLSLHDLIKSRQAVAPAPVFYKTQKQSEKVSKNLKKLKSLGWELENVRDEMGRLSSRVHKLGRRSTAAHDENGQEIQHDLLYHLLDTFQSSPGSLATRKVHHEENYFVKPVNHVHNHKIAAPSASPCPSGRVKRSTISLPTSTANLEQTLSRVFNSFSSTLELASNSLDSLASPSQRASIEALINELRWEMSTLLADTQQDIPELSLPDGY